MKLNKYWIVALVTFVTACQNIDNDGAISTESLSVAPLSKITLSNVSIKEKILPASSKHDLFISFDYRFESAPLASDMYFCTVQFLSKIEGQSTSTTNRLPKQCEFSDPVGTVSFPWSTPFDKSNVNKAKLSDLALPLQYFVAIHQKTSNNKSVVIAQSDTYIGGEQSH